MGRERRFKSIAYVDDEAARTRTVTIVEDLTKTPYEVVLAPSVRHVVRARAERVVESPVAEGNRGVAPVQQSSPVVHATAGPSNVVVAPAPPPPVVNRARLEQSGYEYANDVAPPPPAYKQHEWQSIV